jgi:hypothetical protein
MPRKWIAVRVSAGLAMAGSLLTLALGVMMPISMAMAPRPVGPAAPPFPMMAFGIVMAVIFAAFAAWGIVTAIGIFRRRNWARISIMIFAGLLAIMGVFGGVAALVMTLPPQEGLDPRIMTALRIGMSAFYGLLAGIGIWWLLLFNKQTTKHYFAALQLDEKPGGRPLSISIIGWYLIAASPFSAAMAVFQVPAVICGLVITGWGALAVYSLFAVAQLYLGAGLLQLQEHARIGAVGFFLLGIVNGVLTIIPGGFEAKIEVMRRAAPKFFPAGMPTQMPQPMWVFALMGMVFVAVPIWFLVRQRAAFAGPAAVD